MTFESSILIQEVQSNLSLISITNDGFVFATSLNHRLAFFNCSWDGLDSLFGPVTLILQVMQVNHLASKAPLIFNL